MSGINVSVKSANVGEDSLNSLIFCFHSESTRPNVHVIVNCYGQLKRKPETMILGLEVAKHLRPRGSEPGESRAIYYIVKNRYLSFISFFRKTDNYYLDAQINKLH